MRRFPCLLSVALILAGTATRAWALGEEHFGNDPLPQGNYTDWPGIMPLVNAETRVYQTWINGNEHLYYLGETPALNAALKEFAALKTEVREVVLRPGHAEARTFGGRTLPYDWELHLVGGIARHLTTLEKGDQFWSKSPVLTIYLGGGIELEKLEIPKVVALVGPPNLKKRYVEALSKSSDKTVRGWGCGELAGLDPYDIDSVAAIAARLKDDEMWVRLNAAGALATFGAKARIALDALREAAKSDDKGLKAAAERSIAAIEEAADHPDDERLHRAGLDQIDKFIEMQRKQK